jgi:hypothetical protein
MIVHVRLFGVLLLFVLVVIVVAVGEFVVVVLVGMPVGPMLELAPDHAALVVMGDMVMVM